jgi:dTDP-4-dehydrorhamnose reductase
VIVIFGAGGQVGRELTELCGKRQIAVRGITRAEADIADADAVGRALTAEKPEIVVNAAAYTKVDLAEQQVQQATRANADGPRVLAEVCARFRLPLIHLSTDYVFDGTKVGPYVESDATGPLGVYGRTKLAGEEAVRECQPHHLILRTSWLYGVHGRNLLRTVLALARENDELRFVADQRGCPTATAELAAGILSAVPRLIADHAVAGTYHFAGSGETTWFGFVAYAVDAQAAFTGRRPRVVPIASADFSTAARRPANSVLRSGRFAGTFGFRPRHWKDRVDEAIRQLLGAKAEVVV